MSRCFIIHTHQEKLEGVDCKNRGYLFVRLDMSERKSIILDLRVVPFASAMAAVPKH
jgi:hypothetical protein